MQEFLIDFQEWKKWLTDGTSVLQMDLECNQIVLLHKFVAELRIANETVNLTRVTEPRDMAENLVLDSMVPGKYIPPGSRVLDIGTGAGFPGIPLKIAYPHLSLTLVDSKRKKVNFLKYVVRQLRLEDICVMQSRVEDLNRDHGKFDAAVSRAVTSVDQLHLLAAPLLKPGGMLIAMKGRGYQDELDGLATKQIEKIQPLNIEVCDYCLPFSKMDRALIIVT